MNRPSAGFLFGFLLIVLLAQAGLLFGKGILLIDQHEGDALHLLQIILRMGAGEWPHLNFTTPLGILAFAPISWFVSLGWGVGHAIMGGMVLVAAIMMPAIWWVAYSRLSGLSAYFFGGFLIILITALVYGGAVQVSSISMYYNRWAWAAAFLVVALAVLPSRSGTQAVDGFVLGLALSFLLLSKVTFFAAFFPGVIIALAARQKWQMLGVAILVGVGVVGLMTLIGGVDFWLAYLGDLRLVSASGIRPQPSETLAALLIGPTFLPVNLCLLASIIFLRQAGREFEGFAMLLFAPAFIYVTYQNWGNDPKWLILLAFIIFSCRPERHIHNAFGWNVGRAMGVVGAVSIMLALPSIFNLTFANVRHAKMSREGFFQVLPGEKNADLAMQTERMYAPARREAFDLSDPKIKALVKEAVPTPDDELFGQKLRSCKLSMGLVGVLHQMARDLEKVDGIAGKTVFTADTFSNLWLFGSTKPLKGGAPWYYGGDAGLSGADFVLVPLCPVTPRARTLVLNEIGARRDLDLREVMRNDLFILLENASPHSSGR